MSIMLHSYITFSILFVPFYVIAHVAFDYEFFSIHFKFGDELNIIGIIAKRRIFGTISVRNKIL